MTDDLILIIEDAKVSMKKAIDHLEAELVKIRAGKANPVMLDGLMADYYGSPTPINQLANISAMDARTLSVQPWEKNMLQPIERAIIAANLGINPQNDGSLGLLTSLIFGIYFFVIDQLMFAVMAFAISGSLVAFLIYNFSPAKIFMGDTGSLLLGLLNSIFVVKFISVASDPMFSENFPLQSVPALGFAILIVPLFDTLRVFSLRILNRRSPFSADRNHIHHFLLDLGLSHKMVTLTCVTINILFIALAYFLQEMGTTWVILSLAVCAVLFVSIVYYSRPKSKLINVDPVAKEEKIIKTHKIFTLAGERLEQN